MIWNQHVIWQTGNHEMIWNQHVIDRRKYETYFGRGG